MHLFLRLRVISEMACLSWMLKATFPAGTLSGAPKIRAMEIIEELEPERRSLYGAHVVIFHLQKIWTYDST